MIHKIVGTIIATDNQLITVQPQGTGIGFGISIPQKESYTTGKDITLFTYVHWNQEQGPALYGFTDQLERKVFLLIISCSGIGPKIALAALETMSPEAFINAIYSENIQALSSISGIGKKKAEQVIVHLKHKVQDLISNGIQFEGTAAVRHWQQISEVLTSLNYSRQEITQTVHYLREQQDIPELSFDTLLRRALSFLSKLR